MKKIYPGDAESLSKGIDIATGMAGIALTIAGACALVLFLKWVFPGPDVKAMVEALARDQGKELVEVPGTPKHWEAYGNRIQIIPSCPPNVACWGNVPQ